MLLVCGRSWEMEFVWNVCLRPCRQSASGLGKWSLNQTSQVEQAEKGGAGVTRNVLLESNLKSSLYFCLLKYRHTVKTTVRAVWLCPYREIGPVVVVLRLELQI